MPPGADAAPAVSVVVPVFNSERTLDELVTRLRATLADRRPLEGHADVDAAKSGVLEQRPRRAIVLREKVEDGSARAIDRPKKVESHSSRSHSVGKAAAASAGIGIHDNSPLLLTCAFDL